MKNNSLAFQESPSRPCVICGGLEHRLLFRQNFSLMTDSGSLLPGYDVVACNTCGFCFADHIPEQAVFDTYYREMSKYEYQDNVGRVSKYDLAKFQLITTILKDFLHSPRDRILEIGCSTGALLSILRQNGYEFVLGVDPSPICAEAADRLYGIRVLVGTLSEIVEQENSFDVLILVGVLEHIRNLEAALEKCRNLLVDGGLIFIAVPDASRYFEGSDAPFQEFSVEHINFFGRVSLSNLLLINGFAEIWADHGIVEANYHTITPIIRGVYKKRRMAISPSFTPDIDTEKGIRLYVDQCMRQDSLIQSTIARISSDRKPIIVWGTGTHTLRLLATSKLAGANIRAYVDSNPRYQGKQINDVPIISPQELRNMPEPILISSRAYQEEIANHIRNDLQLDNEIIKLY